MCICIVPWTVGEGECESGRAEQQEQLRILWFALGQLPDVVHHIIMSGSEKGSSSEHVVTSCTLFQMQLRRVINLWYYFYYLHRYVIILCLK